MREHRRPSRFLRSPACLFLALALPPSPLPTLRAAEETPEKVLAGIRSFFERTALEDGSFRPGIDPGYQGMSDSAASDLAPVTYAVVLHATFGWRLPREEMTRKLLRERQDADGAFRNVKGTYDPGSPQARLYNTTQGLVALHALGERARYDPLPVLEAVLREDYKALPPYTTSFFPLAYLAQGAGFPHEADARVGSLLVQAEDGYLHNHIAATFHAVHYYRLLGRPTPKAGSILRRVERDQRTDGSWLLNPPSRDRHATFDACFVLRQLGGEREESRAALSRAVGWVLRSRNPDGGFGHFPGSPSDADAVYFHAGTLVMAGFLKPVEPLPKEAHLLGWGHLMPPP